MKELTCIVCPNGCRLKVEETDGEFAVTGNRCKRGEEFAVREMTAPTRSVCSTVRTIYPQVPVLPVRTASQIPREMIFRVMEEINKALITRPMERGETVIPDVCGLGVDVIATSSVLKWKGVT